MRRAAAATLLALLVACAQAGDAPPPKPAPLDLVQTIALPGVKGRIDHLALDAKRKRLYVAALGNGSVEMVDLAKGARARRIEGLEEPQGIAYLADLDRLVVACGGDGSVRFYDGDTLQATATVDLGADADNVRYDAAAQRVWVGFGGGAVGSVDATKPAALGKVDVGAHPESFQLETAGRRIFVNAAGAAEVVVADRSDLKVLARWKLDGARANFPMALDEPAKRLWIGCRSPATLLALSTDDGKVAARVTCSDDPDDVFVDAKRGRVYVSCGAGVVDVFTRGDAGAPELLAHTPTRRGARTALFDAAGDRLFVAVPRDGSQDAEIRVFAPK